MIITLKRVYLPTETLGSMYNSAGELICKTMELPWRDNKTSVSCIPEGVYDVFKQPPKEKRPYWYYRLPDAQTKRKGILIHRITYVKDLLGCIGVGSRFADFNKDGVPDIEQSGKKLQWMIDNLPENWVLRIEKKE